MQKKNNLPAPQRWTRLAWSTAIAATLTLLAFFEPRSNLPFPIPHCGFHSMTGLPCAFCGGTRAARALLRGDVRQALYLNAIAFPFLLALTACAVVMLIEAAGGRAMSDWNALASRSSRMLPLLLALAAAWWLPHLLMALQTPKPELLNLKNPIAAKARESVQRLLEKNP